MLKNILSKFIYMLYLFVIVAIVLEIFLRFYSPIPVRLRGNDIVLPKNQKYSLPNSNFTKISKNALHTKNSIGFRGEEWDANSKRVKMLFVGGSTTECFYTDDQKHWPFLVSKKLGAGYLVNNAGLNGHSTFGHISLLNGFLAQLKPNYAFFLIGINDSANTDNGANSFDTKLTKRNLQYYVLQIEEYSRLVNLMHSFYRSYQAYKLGVKDGVEWKLMPQKEARPLENLAFAEVIENHTQAQENYKNRILEIIEICKKSNVKPIFITQPLLFGKGIDPSTGVDLQHYQVYLFDGGQYYNKLELYNNTLRNICLTKGVNIIDLANLLPKDSRYYVDDMHFSDEGCEKVSEIVIQNFKK